MSAMLILLNSIFIFYMKNPIYSLILLILNYIIGGVIFIFNGLVFIGLMFMFIYCGAVSILLIFTLMLLNLRTIYFKSVNIENAYNVIFYSILVLLCFILFTNKKVVTFLNTENLYVKWFELLNSKSESINTGYELFVNNADIIPVIAMFLTFILIVSTSVVSQSKDTKNQELFKQLKVIKKKIIS